MLTKKANTLIKNSNKVNSKLNLFTNIHESLIEKPKPAIIEEEVVEVKDTYEDEVIVEILTPEQEEEYEERRKFNIKQQEIHELAKIEEECDVEIIDDNERKLYLDTSELKRIKSPASARKRMRPVEQYLSVKLGSDGRKLLDRVIEQALYVYDKDIDGAKPLYSEETVRFSQKILFDYGFYKPTVKQEKNIEVSVEHRLDDALKAIHENRERIKLLK